MSTCIAPTSGLSGYKTHGCRCPDCTGACREREAHRSRMIAYGRWQPFVDAEPVRQHLLGLRAAGVGIKRVATLSGLTTFTIRRVSKPTTDRVSRQTANLILAIQAGPAVMAGGVMVDATGTRRRLRALAAIGWSFSELGRRLDRKQQFISHLAEDGCALVTAATTRRVAELYDQLSGTPAPPSQPATRARRNAEREGWAPPLAWEEDTIDDPAAQPDPGKSKALGADWLLVERALHGEAVELTQIDRHAAVQEGRRRGVTHTRLALLLRMSNARVAEYETRPLPDCDTPEAVAA